MSNNMETPTRRICCFCGLTDDNEIRYGKFYEHNGIVTHYYCLLLSSCMEQKGEDDEGILGFLEVDIQKELRRGKKLVCSYCKQPGATLGCNNVKCSRKFHYPCGLEAGSLHQFFGEFRSFCVKHRPKQKIDNGVKREIKNANDVTCYICYDRVEPDNIIHTLWAPCCKKNAWFHRTCVQQLAMSAGYFFKCPLCNDKKKFQEAMLEFGIFIPSQDASWELVPNAFHELLYRHDECDAATCLCPKGRKYTSNNARWELILCRTCGSQGIHMGCGQLKWVNPIWECSECISILRKSNEASNSGATESARRNDADTEDSGSDISVGRESPAPIASSSLSHRDAEPPRKSSVSSRPAPRSVKLREQMRENLRLQESNSQCVSTKIDSGSDSTRTEEMANNDGTCTIKCPQSPANAESLKRVKADDQSNQRIESQSDADVIMIDSDDDDVVEIPCHKSSDYMPPTNNSCPTRANSKILEPKCNPPLQEQTFIPITNLSNTSTSAAGSFNVSVKSNLNARRSDDCMIQSNKTQDERHLKENCRHSFDSIANIKIVNVTSLAPEEFQNDVIETKEPNGIAFPSTLDCLGQLHASVSMNDDFTPEYSTQQSDDVAETHLKRKSVNEFTDDIVVPGLPIKEAGGQKRVKRDEPDDYSLRKSLTSSNMPYDELEPEFDFVDPSIPVQSTDGIAATEFYKKPERVTDVVQLCLAAQPYSDSCKESTVNNISQTSISQTVLQHNANFNNNNNNNSDNDNNDDAVYRNLSGFQEREYVHGRQNSTTEESRAFEFAAYNNGLVAMKNVSSTEWDDDAPVVVSGYIANTDQLMHERNGPRITNDEERWTAKYENTLNQDAVAMDCDGDAGTDPARLSQGGRIVNDEGRNEQRRQFVDSGHCCSASWDWTKNRADAAQDIESTRVPCQFGNDCNACDHPRLIPEYVHLHDLRFRVRASDNLEMILYDKLYVNINMDTAMKQDSSSSRLNESARKPGDAKLPDEENETPSSVVEYGDVLHNLERDNKHFNTVPSIPSVNNVDACKYNNTVVTTGHPTNYRDDAKENLDPIGTIPCKNVTNTFIASVNLIDNNVKFSTNTGGSRNEQEISLQRVSKSTDVCSNGRWNDRGSIGLTDSAPPDSNVTNIIKIQQRALENGCSYQNLEDSSDDENISFPKESLLDGGSSYEAKNPIGKYTSRNVQSLRSDHVSSSTTEKSKLGAQCTLSPKDSVSRTIESNSRSNESETCCRVSIDLNKVQNFVDANPVLFSKAKKDGDERCYEGLSFLKKRSNIIERLSLRSRRNIAKSVLNRSKSLNNYKFPSSTDTTTIQLATYSSQNTEDPNDTVSVQKSLMQEARPINGSLLNNTRVGLRRTSKHFEKQCVLDR